MENSSKMKWIKAFLGYFVIVFLLIKLYDPQTTLMILFHYPTINLKYLMFIFIQFYWITLFYDIVYQYICLYQPMRTRLMKKECLFIILKRLLLYCFISYAFNLIILSCLSLPIPFLTITINLFIQLFAILLVIVLKQAWEYSYILLILLTLLCHFIV